MPLNVRRFSSSIFLVFISFTSAVFSQAQQAVNQPSTVPSNTTPVKTVSAAEVMRERISKAKAYIAVRNYNAAIFELESIRRETSDTSVHSVLNILLMNSYLEQGNYKKAQDFLNEFYKDFKSNNANAAMQYSAVAAQVVKGARSQLERYRQLGLSVSDRNLPLEAVNDVERMREVLELIIKQTREAGLDKAKSAVVLPLLDEATNVRSSFARDDYDAKRWQLEGDDAREQMVNARSVVTNATDGTTVPTATPQNNTSADLAANMTEKPIDSKPVDTQTAVNIKPVGTFTKIVETPVKTDQPKEEVGASKPSPKNDPTKSEATKEGVAVPNDTVPQAKPSGPVEVGSLIEYATSRSNPTYPPAARTMRASGVVKVEVEVDENGDVAEVKKANGPQLLIAAARDAILKWKFRPIIRDGQPVRVTGFVNFNFTL
ncbi:MAG: TonB family protein [Pyrinomonadaceae bacterium]